MSSNLDLDQDRQNVDPDLDPNVDPDLEPNCLNPDQDRRSVGPDLGPNCLQRLSTDGTKSQLK